MLSNRKDVGVDFRWNFHTLVTIAGLHPAAGGSRDS